MNEIGSGCQVVIRNCGGVPVVQVVGNANTVSLRTLESTVLRLAEAGHYHIVLNIERMAGGLQLLSNLHETAKRVIDHYGIIDLVANSCQLKELGNTLGLNRLFRLCASEIEAIRRIKRLVRLPDPDEQGCCARIMEEC